MPVLQILTARFRPRRKRRKKSRLKRRLRKRLRRPRLLLLPRLVHPPSILLLSLLPPPQPPPKTRSVSLSLEAWPARAKSPRLHLMPKVLMARRNPLSSRVSSASPARPLSPPLDQSLTPPPLLRSLRMLSPQPRLSLPPKHPRLLLLLAPSSLRPPLLRSQPQKATFCPPPLPSQPPLNCGKSSTTLDNDTN